MRELQEALIGVVEEHRNEFGCEYHLQPFCDESGEVISATLTLNVVDSDERNRIFYMDLFDWWNRNFPDIRLEIRYSSHMPGQSPSPHVANLELEVLLQR
jgi:hypothetical protein